jgi:hypothetical protein
MIQQFCSNIVNDDKNNTCYDRKTLLQIITIHNIQQPFDAIINYKKKKLNTLLLLLQQKFKTDIELEWLSILKTYDINNDYIVHLSNIEKKFFIPIKPNEWINNPIMWLTNYDIENILIQYHNNSKQNYHFHGVFAIDFSLKDNKGVCVFNHLCNIDIKALLKKKIKYIGFVTNLDKHDEPGSHWTSTFIIIDKNINAYGAYYYDSGAKTTPKYVNLFLKDVCSQLNIINPNSKFKMTHNKYKHQFKNTECGMFSIYYQIRWLEMLEKNCKTTFKEVTKHNITDDKMILFRDIIFRPKIK